MKVIDLDNPQRTKEEEKKTEKTVEAWEEKDELETQHDPADMASLALSIMTFKFMDSVTMHGLRYIFMRDAHVLRRLVWIIVVFSGMGYCCYIVYQSFTSYLSYPAISNTRRVFESQSEFPAVTLCSYNMFRKSKLTEKQRQAIESVYSLHLLSLGEKHLNLSEYDDLDMLEFFRNTTDAIKPSWCLYKGRQCKTTFLNLTLTEYGFCYVFDASTNEAYKYQKTAGHEGGLDMAEIINASEWSYGPHMVYAGQRVAIHAPGTNVHYLRDKGFSLLPGYTTDVTITRKEIQLLPPPHGQCGSTKLKFFDEYSREKCLVECESKHLLEVCGCRFIYMPGDGRICTLEETHRCNIYLKDSFNEETRVFDQTECNCPQECNYVEYDLDVRQTAPAQGYLDLVKNQFGMDIVNGGFQFRVYYQNLEYIEVIQESVYSFEKLLCDCGGAGGLFLGCSFATMFEFVDFGAEVIWMWAVRRYSLHKREIQTVN